MSLQTWLDARPDRCPAGYHATQHPRFCACTALTPTPQDEFSIFVAALKAAAEGAMKGVLAYTDQPLVSTDFNHQPPSSTVDSLETAVLEGKLGRVVSWYDNEWGFSNRMIDTAGAMAKFL